MRYLVAVLLLPILSAQQPTDQQPGPRDRAPAIRMVQAALQRSASTVDTGFVMRYRSAGKRAPVRGRAPRPESVVTVTGSFHDGVQVSTIEPKSREVIQVLQTGRHTMVRVNAKKWRVGDKHPKTGGPLPHLSDAQCLMRLLGTMKLDIVDRSVDSWQGQTCEFFAVRLNAQQTETLEFAGVITPASQNDKNLRKLLARRPGGGGQSKTVTDLAIAIDVKSRLVASVVVRSAGDPVDIHRLRRVFGAPEPEDEKKEAAEVADASAAAAKAIKSPNYVRGLPVRSTEGKYVVTLELDLRDHGKITPPVLDAEQLRLLGR